MWLQERLQMMLHMPEGGSSVYCSLSVRWTVLGVTLLADNSSLLFGNNSHPIDLQLGYNKLNNLDSSN